MCNFKKLLIDEEKEGYLNDGQTDLKVLFILREPDSPTWDSFFMKNVVKSKGKTGGLRYYNILKKLAQIVLNKADDDNIFQECAFINLYPHDGKSSAGDGFYKTLNTIKKLPNGEVKNETSTTGKDILEIANKRIDLINNLPKGTKIITVQDIYKALAKPDKEKYMTYKKGAISKDFFCSQCRFNNNVIVYEFWHPSYTHIAYQPLIDITKSANHNINRTD